MFGMSKMMIAVSDSIFSTISYSAYVKSLSPIAYWRVGELAGTDMIDSSGNGNDGTYNGTTLGEDSLLVNDTDTAIYNSGNPNHMSTTMTMPNTSAMSTSFLVNGDYSGSPTFICDSYNNGGIAGTKIWLKLHNDYWYTAISNDAQNWDDYTSTLHNLTNYETYHIVLTVSGSSVKIYVNGVLVYDQTASISLSGAGTGDIYIAKLGTYSSGFYFVGYMDEICIFDKALTEEQATTLYSHSIDAVSYWRITVTDNNGGQYVGIDQIEFLLSDTDQTVPENVLENVITASSQENVSNSPDNAFNNLAVVDQWTSDTVVQGNINEWIQYQSLTAIGATAVSIRSNTVDDHSTNMPKDFIVQKSNNGTDWVTVRTVAGSSGWSIGEKRTFAFM